MFVKIFQNSADEEMGEKSKQIHACMICMPTLEKHMYSHANMPLGQTKHVYSIILVTILINMYDLLFYRV